MGTVILRNSRQLYKPSRVDAEFKIAGLGSRRRYAGWPSRRSPICSGRRRGGRSQNPGPIRQMQREHGYAIETAEDLCAGPREEAHDCRQDQLSPDLPCAKQQ
jgi:hypothetical protein